MPLQSRFLLYRYILQYRLYQDFAKKQTLVDSFAYTKMYKQEKELSTILTVYCYQPKCVFVDVNVAQPLTYRWGDDDVYYDDYYVDYDDVDDVAFNLKVRLLSTRIIILINELCVFASRGFRSLWPLFDFRIAAEIRAKDERYHLDQQVFSRTICLPFPSAFCPWRASLTVMYSLRTAWFIRVESDSL